MQVEVFSSSLNGDGSNSKSRKLHSSTDVANMDAWNSGKNSTRTKDKKTKKTVKGSTKQGPQEEGFGYGHTETLVYNNQEDQLAGLSGQNQAQDVGSDSNPVMTVPFSEPEPNLHETQSSESDYDDIDTQVRSRQKKKSRIKKLLIKGLIDEEQYLALQLLEQGYIPQNPMTIGLRGRSAHPSSLTYRDFVQPDKVLVPMRKSPQP